MQLAKPKSLSYNAPPCGIQIAFFHGQSPGHHGLKIIVMQNRSAYKGTMWSSQVVFLSGQYLKQRMREGQPKGREIKSWEGPESLVLRIILRESQLSYR